MARLTLQSLFCALIASSEARHIALQGRRLQILKQRQNIPDIVSSITFVPAPSGIPSIEVPVIIEAPTPIGGGLGPPVETVTVSDGLVAIPVPMTTVSGAVLPIPAIETTDASSDLATSVISSIPTAASSLCNEVGPIATLTITERIITTVFNGGTSTSTVTKSIISTIYNGGTATETVTSTKYVDRCPSCPAPTICAPPPPPPAPVTITVYPVPSSVPGGQVLPGSGDSHPGNGNVGPPPGDNNGQPHQGQPGKGT